MPATVTATTGEEWQVLHKHVLYCPEFVKRIDY